MSDDIGCPGETGPEARSTPSAVATTDSRPHTSWHRQLWALAPVVLVAAAFRFDGGRISEDGRTLVAYAPWIAKVLALSAPAWFVTLVVARVWTRGRRGPSAVALVAALMLGLALSCVGPFVGRGTTWRMYGTAAPDGESARAPSAGPVWGAFGRGFTDHDVAFVRRVSQGAFVTRWDVVAIAPSDGDGVPIVRPEALGAAQGLVVRNGCLAVLGSWPVPRDRPILLVAVREDGAPIHPLVRTHGDPPDDRRTPSEDPSPFVLVEPDDELHAADVDALVDAIAAEAARPEPLLYGLPTDAALVRALGSRHAGVRAAAERLVRAGGATLYPEATKRL